MMFLLIYSSLRIIFAGFIGVMGWWSLKRWEAHPEVKQAVPSVQPKQEPVLTDSSEESPSPAMAKILTHHLPAPSLLSPPPSPLAYTASSTGNGGHFSFQSAGSIPVVARIVSFAHIFASDQYKYPPAGKQNNQAIY